MPHTPLLYSLRNLMAAHRIAAESRRPVEEVAGRLAEARAQAHEQARAQTGAPAGGAGHDPSCSRRGFLLGASALAAGALLPSALGCCTTGSGRDGGAGLDGHAGDGAARDGGGGDARRPDGGAGDGGRDGGRTDGGGGPRIAIVGGGIAGLAAAVTLADGGYASTIYEVSGSRVGGRIVSERGSEHNCGICHQPPPGATDMLWEDGQVGDPYGELIDSGHETMHALAKRFNLEMVNALVAEPAGATETYYFNGAYYLKADADKDFAAIYAALQKDAEDAGYPTTYDQSTAAGKLLDNLSIYDWIDSRVPGGHTSRLGKLLDVAYLIEYGSETRDLSSLELIYMLSSAEADSFSVFGESDEAWRVKGGNDQLPRAMANHLGLGSRVLLGWDFTAIRKESDGTYTLSFEVSGGGGAKEVRADYVVLAIPFTKLRTLDYARAGFDALKIEAITQQGGGRNGKLQLQFRKRLWNEQGPWGVSGGTSYSDTGSQLTWDPTRGQPGTSGIMVCYTGGERAAAAKLKHAYGNASDPNVLEDARTFLTQVEPLFPGLTAQWNGKASETLCHLDPRFYCSYSYWRVGQTQRFGGYERVPQGNVFFAGEHTSVDYLGFMEGAASEGVSAGQEMLALLPKRAPMPALPGRKHGRRGRGAAARQAPRQR